MRRASGSAQNPEVAVDNAEIADRFELLADLLSIEGANPFRVRAYRNAARTIRSYPKRMTDLVAARAELDDLPGIGKDLAGKIAALVQTDRLPLLEQVAARTPPVLAEIMRIRGLGPRRVQALHRALAIRSIADLERAAQSGKLRSVPGFGLRTERVVLDGIRRLARSGRRFRLDLAEDAAKRLVAHLERCVGVDRVEIAGSFRRRRETVGDLDILVTAARGTDVASWLAGYDEVADILSQGPTRASVRLRSGMTVDLRVVPKLSFGAAMHYFTGAKAHTIAVRALGGKRGYKINEYGVFKGRRRIAGKRETDVFASVGLDYIPPELREDTGEIEAAREHELPNLVTSADIRGDLHCHSQASDGLATIEAMATAAADRHYEYLSINDHSKRVAIANGLDENRVLSQLQEIDELNSKLRRITILKSIEVEILEDGSLDLPDRVLKELDFTVCAIHYQFGLSEKRQTERILRAMDNRYFTILAHPTGRLLDERAPYLIDLEKVLEHAGQRRCYLEVNAHPSRLDLNDRACRMAKEAGVLVAISSDAHDAVGLDSMRFGIDQARRGWMTADDVLNTRSIEALRALLRR